MSSSRTINIPSLIYGTAWKKDRSRELVKQAVSSGFRGVDTAAQPKHYREDLVGKAVYDAIRSGVVRREDLYIQTKFTSIHGQDPTHLPYDASSSITEQVRVSVASSLRNFRDSGASQTSDAQPYIDCLLLHSPYPSMSETREAWAAMESHVPHDVRTLGISNVYEPQLLQAFYQSAKIKPRVVQNRFYAATGYDYEIREFCDENGMRYQSFWTLTANPELLRSDVVEIVARDVGVSRPVALYALTLGLKNVSILDGTTNAERMKEDLAGVELVQDWVASNAEEWSRCLGSFGSMLRQ